jgi:uncharacterized protein
VHSVTLDQLDPPAQRPARGVYDPATGLERKPVKYVLFYVPVDDVASKAPAHFPAHSARLDEFHSRGTLLMVGTFGDPQEEGSMAIFTTREAAEEFVRGDPFVLNGVIRDWHIREWDEVLAP